MPRKVATHSDAIDIYEKLKTKIRIIAHGRCEYIDGYDDNRIATLMNVGLNSVSDIRRKKFGNLINKDGPKKNQRLDDLEAKVDLYAEMAEKMVKWEHNAEERLSNMEKRLGIIRLVQDKDTA